MSYIEGETLGQRLRARGSLPPATAARLLREVAWALAYAHGRGVVHRDVKPDNILIERDTGRAMVTDFGIAQMATAVEVTDPGRVLGTAHFMSPEQAANEPVDGRSDLYSLGVVGYLALSGRLPFDAPTVPALLAKHLTEPAPLLAAAAPAVPDRLARVIDRCLTKSREARFATGEALAEALEAESCGPRELPVALRVWLQKQSPMQPFFTAWSVVCGMISFFSVLNLLTPRGFGGHDYLPVFVAAGLALAPALPMLVFHLRETRRVLRAGYSLADLRLALERWIAERRKELDYDDAGSHPIAQRIARVLFFGSIAGLVARVAFDFGPETRVRNIVDIAIGIAFLGGAGASAALGVPLFGRRLKRAMVGALRSAFWNGRLGEITAKLLAWGKKRLTPAQLLDRPTEAALSLAAGDLFAALPKAYREQLRDIPDVVRRLEKRAAGARHCLDLLAGADGDLTAAQRADAGSELTHAVAALESIRLDLLRLQSEAVSAESITNVLEAAQHVGSQLNTLIAARAEIQA